MKTLLFILLAIVATSKHLSKLRKTKTHVKVREDEKKDEEPKIIAGFNSKAITPPISKCNEIAGEEGELAYDLDNVRNTTKCFLTMNMWTMSIFGNQN